MYAGFTTTEQQDRERWELMQRRAEQAAAQDGEPQPAAGDRSETTQDWEVIG